MSKLLTHTNAKLGGLTRREAATLRGHWTEITAYLAPPGVAWEWAESQLSERVKHYLRHHGLIRRHRTVQGCWETTERLWMWVINNAGDDECIGTGATGQETLPVESTAPRSRSRVARCSTPSQRETRTRQVTLTGDFIDPDDPASLGDFDASGTRTAVNARKNPARLTGQEKAAHHPTQTQLDDGWCATVIDATGSGYWVIQQHTTAAAEGSNVRLQGV